MTGPYLHAMFVRSGQQLCISVSDECPPSLDDIGKDHSIQMTDMRGYISQDISSERKSTVKISEEVIPALT